MRVSRPKAIALFGALQLAIASVLAGQQAGVQALFPERPTGFVTDQAHVIDDGARSAMEAKLTRLRERTGAEVAVVTLPTLGDYEPAQVALEIGRRWGVGSKAKIGDATRNAGVVLLVVPKTEASGGRGRLRIEVGDGLEGVVTDAIASRIRDAMRPQLAAGDYAGGMNLGVELLADEIARGLGVRDSVLSPPRREGGGIPIGLLLLVFIMFLFIASSLSRRGGGGRGGRGGGPPIFWGGPPLGGGGGGWGGGSGFGGGGGGFSFGGGGGFSGGGSGGDY